MDRVEVMVRPVVPVGFAAVKVTLLIGESAGGCLLTGWIVADRLTVPVNPLTADTVIVSVIVEPLAITTDAGLTASWKSGAWIVMIFDATGVVWYVL